MWTFASGNDDNNTASVDVTLSSDEFACPCAAIPGLSPFAFVHDNYYCESGSDGGGHVDNIYISDPLWDGSQCDGAGDNCCAEGQPWFYRQFPVAYQSNVEARICADEGYNNEGVLVDRLQLFVM